MIGDSGGGGFSAPTKKNSKRKVDVKDKNDTKKTINLKDASESIATLLDAFAKNKNELADAKGDMNLEDALGAVSGGVGAITDGLSKQFRFLEPKENPSSTIAAGDTENQPDPVVSEPPSEEPRTVEPTDRTRELNRRVKELEQQKRQIERRMALQRAVQDQTPTSEGGYSNEEVTQLRAMGGNQRYNSVMPNDPLIQRLAAPNTSGMAPPIRDSPPTSATYDVPKMSPADAMTRLRAREDAMRPAPTADDRVKRTNDAIKAMARKNNMAQVTGAMNGGEMQPRGIDRQLSEAGQQSALLNYARRGDETPGQFSQRQEDIRMANARGMGYYDLVAQRQNEARRMASQMAGRQHELDVARAENPVRPPDPTNDLRDSARVRAELLNDRINQLQRSLGNALEEDRGPIQNQIDALVNEQRSLFGGVGPRVDVPVGVTGYSGEEAAAPTPSPGMGGVADVLSGLNSAVTGVGAISPMLARGAESVKSGVGSLLGYGGSGQQQPSPSQTRPGVVNTRGWTPITTVQTRVDRSGKTRRVQRMEATDGTQRWFEVE